MDEVSSYVRLNLPFVSLRQGRPKDCSTSSSNPMMEGPWCRVRREARARERHRHCSSGKASKRLTPAGRLEKSTARSTKRLFHLVFESHDGRALVPIPKRSASP